MSDFCDPMSCIARQAPLSVGVSRQEYWDGLPCPSPRIDPGIKPRSLALQADSLPPELQGKPIYMCVCVWGVYICTHTYIKPNHFAVYLKLTHCFSLFSFIKFY